MSIVLISDINSTNITGYSWEFLATRILHVAKTARDDIYQASVLNLSSSSSSSNSSRGYVHVCILLTEWVSSPKPLNTSLSDGHPFRVSSSSENVTLSLIYNSGSELSPTHR